MLLSNNVCKLNLSKSLDWVCFYADKLHATLAPLLKTFDYAEALLSHSSSCFSCSHRIWLASIFYKESKVLRNRHEHKSQSIMQKFHIRHMTKVRVVEVATAKQFQHEHIIEQLLQCQVIMSEINPHKYRHYELALISTTSLLYLS